MNNISGLTPLSWFPSLFALFCVASLIYVTHYVFVPYYTKITGLPYLTGYLIGWITNVVIIFITSLSAFRIEGNKFSLRNLSIRFRLKKMSGKDWIWTLPRQEVAFGKFAWLINGTVFTFQHWLQPWNFLAILPGALFMSLVIQLRKNTWIGIIQHGLMNLGLFFHILRGVAG